MRFFPSASRSRLLVATTVCALAAGAVAVPLAQADDHQRLQQQREEVEEQIDHAHEELEHSSRRAQRAGAALDAALARLDAAKDELGVASARLEVARIRDAEMQRRLADAEARLEAARAELEAGEAAVVDQRDAVADTVASIYQQGDRRLIAFSSLLEAQDPNDLLRRVEANRTVVTKEDGAYDQLRATEVLLRVKEERVEEARRAVAGQRAEAAAHLASMQVLHDEARAARSKVATLVGSSRAARSEADAARRADEAVLRRLEQREARIKQRILAAARQARRARSGVVGRPASLLGLPSSGPVTSPFGYRRHPIYRYYGLHDGTDFGAPCGSPLRAIADGRVMSVYFSPVYGRRLYLNVGRVNGRFLTAVYNHATRYTVRPGERVQRGEVVGYVGSSGWSTGCHLHFTLLANGRAVNPMSLL